MDVVGGRVGGDEGGGRVQAGQEEVWFCGLLLDIVLPLDSMNRSGSL